MMVRESLRDLIESLGYDVATFESAERFLKATYLAETSGLITDLQMPGLSGMQGRLIADGHCAPSFSLLDRSSRGLGTSRLTLTTLIARPLHHSERMCCADCLCR